MELATLQALYINELKDLYSAENQILKALPKMVKAASSEDLQNAFEEHLEQTKTHVERLEQIFDKLQTSPKGKKCKAMEGLIEEGKGLMEEDGEAEVLDAGLIAAAQKVEHYEIASYGTLRQFAETLGLPKAVALLEETLSEEKIADEKLTEVALRAVNVQASEEEETKTKKSSK